MSQGARGRLRVGGSQQALRPAWKRSRKRRWGRCQFVHSCTDTKMVARLLSPEILERIRCQYHINRCARSTFERRSPRVSDNDEIDPDRLLADSHDISHHRCSPASTRTSISSRRSTLSGHRTKRAYEGYARRTFERALHATRKRYAHALANAHGTSVQNATGSVVQNEADSEDAAIA